MLAKVQCVRRPSAVELLYQQKPSDGAPGRLTMGQYTDLWLCETALKLLQDRIGVLSYLLQFQLYRFVGSCSRSISGACPSMGLLVMLRRHLGHCSVPCAPKKLPRRTAHCGGFVSLTKTITIIFAWLRSAFSSSLSFRLAMMVMMD